MAGDKEEEVVGKKEEEGIDKVEMSGMIEEKGASTEQRVEDKKVVVVKKELIAIEEGAEKEEGVEKERVATGKIWNKQGYDYLKPWWCTNVRKMITLSSSDGKQFKMTEAAARLSSVLADMIDEKGFTNDNIPFPNISSDSLAAVIKYCNKHTTTAATKPDADHNATSENTMGNTASSEKTLEEWDRELVDNLTTEDLLGLIHAAYFLNIKDLQKITCKKVSNMIKGKTTEQMREMFNIANDFTEEEEEEEIHKENPWTFPDNN